MSGQEGSVEHETRYLSAFLSVSGADDFPSAGSNNAPRVLRECSRNAPGDAHGSLACVHNYYCLVFKELFVFKRAWSRPP